MFHKALRMLALVVLGCAVVVSSVRCASSNERVGRDKGWKRVCGEWTARLAERTFSGQSLDSLRKVLGNAIEDEARSARGGSWEGQEAYFKLTDLVVVYVPVTVDDRVVGEPIVFKAKRWPKQRQGYFTTELELWQEE